MAGWVSHWQDGKQPSNVSIHPSAQPFSRSYHLFFCQHTHPLVPLHSHLSRHPKPLHLSVHPSSNHPPPNHPPPIHPSSNPLSPNHHPTIHHPSNHPKPNPALSTNLSLHPSAYPSSCSSLHPTTKSHHSSTAPPARPCLQPSIPSSHTPTCSPPPRWCRAAAC